MICFVQVFLELFSENSRLDGEEAPNKSEGQICSRNTINPFRYSLKVIILFSIMFFFVFCFLTFSP